ncbi:hypothetical protein [Cucumibacter marinus]|uniref:hypothetical protein n=1 Tax=Cucumibacter marinus TaxID=1121252 RepID=UPI000428CD58|nr:hypothetical protein [Cucumibacter marinus]
MADYKELLRRAIAALPENNGAARRTVYEKARGALVAQLRAIEPPLPARDITQHRLNLEDCIRQVEQEATQSLLRHHDSDPDATEPDLAEELVPEPQPVRNVLHTRPSEVAEEAETGGHPASNGHDQHSELKSQPPAPKPAPKPAPQPAPKSAPKPQAAPRPAPTPAPAKVATANAPRPAPQPAPQSGAATASAVRLAEVPVVDSIEAVIAQSEIEDEPRARAKPAPRPAGNDEEPPSELTAAISAAMSSVREVEVEDSPVERAETLDDDDNPQAAIDRAIAALDREANSPTPDELEEEDEPVYDYEPEPEPEPEPVRRPAAAPQQQAQHTHRVEEPEPPRLNEPVASDPGPSVEDSIFAAFQEAPEPRRAPVQRDDDRFEASVGAEFAAQADTQEGGGRNGLTIFLVVVVLLLVGAGGAGFWAWREGMVDISGLMAQVAGGDDSGVTTTSEPEPEPTTQQAETPVPANTQPSGNTNQQGTTQDVADQTAGPNTGSGKTDERLPAQESGVRVIGESAPQVTDPAEGNTQVGQNPGEDTEVADLGDSADTAGLPDPALSVGSQSILLEEQGGSAGRSTPFSGTVEWTRDVDELGEPVIRGVASIPARNLTVDLLIRKNSDDALPASHLMEINFNVQESFVGGGIASLPGVLLKDQELAQGKPLVGASARVFDNSFLFALSADQADETRNLELLSGQEWVDLPLVYSTGRRAIITLEKGEEGQSVFDGVMTAWGNGG